MQSDIGSFYLLKIGFFIGKVKDELFTNAMVISTLLKIVINYKRMMKIHSMESESLRCL
jgi:hypothetical protein